MNICWNHSFTFVIIIKKHSKQAFFKNMYQSIFILILPYCLFYELFRLLQLHSDHVPHEAKELQVNQVWSGW